MSPIAALFLSCGERIRAGLDTSELAIRWDESSSLEQMSIGGLAAHLCGAVFTVERYLDQPDAEITRSIETVAEYFSAALEDSDYYDGIDSELQRGVRGRASDLAAKGPIEILEDLDTTIEKLTERLSDSPDRITVLGGISMPVDAYLEGRIIEMIVHYDDLDRCLTTDLPELPVRATDLAVDRLVGIAKRRHGTKSVTRALTRPELAADISVF